MPEFADANRQIAGPVWIGDQPIAGKRILLQSEQGLGDTIQFCRYATHVADQGAEVLLSVQRELQPLLAQVEGASAVFARGDTLPPFDLQCPLLSLPFACGTTVNSVPDDMPNLVAPQDRVETWRARPGRIIDCAWGLRGQASSVTSTTAIAPCCWRNSPRWIGSALRCSACKRMSVAWIARCRQPFATFNSSATRSPTSATPPRCRH